MPEPQLLQALRQTPASEEAGIRVLKGVDQVIEQLDGPDKARLLSAKAQYCLRFNFTQRSYLIEIAITSLEEVLSILSFSEFPSECADAHSNLGVAYSERGFESRAANMERAIEYLRRAIEGFEHLKDFEGLAEANLNLGAVYTERVSGAQAENQEEALSCYEQVGSIISADSHPALWAKAEMNRGNLYRSRIKGSLIKNLEQAIGCYRAALEILDRQTLPEDWARCRMNLGIAYARRAAGFDGGFVEQAIASFLSVLPVYAEPQYALKQAQAFHNLGNAYCDRLEGDTGRNRDRAIIYFRRALSVRKNADDPFRFAQSLNSLGTAFFERTRGDRTTNLKCAALFLEEALEIYIRMSVPVQVVKAAHNLALVLGALSEWEKVHVLSRRVLFDNNQLLRSTGSADEHRYLISEASRLKDMGVLAHLEQGRIADGWNALVQGQGRLFQLWRGAEGIENQQETRIDPGVMTIAFLVPPKGFDVRVLIHFVDADGRPIMDMVELDGFGMTQLEELLYEEDSGVLGWVKGYQSSRKSGSPGEFFKSIDRAMASLRDALNPLWDRLGRVPEPRQIDWVVSSALALFPVHWAMPKSLREGVLKGVEHQYRPSLAVSNSGHPHQPFSSRLVCVGDPRDDLPFGREEAVEVAGAFKNAELLVSSEATVDRVIAALRQEPSPRYVHFSCHGRYAWSQPEKSGLDLADSARLSLEDIQTECDLSSAELVVLSACESGVTDFRRLPSESFGLPLIFLNAGAQYVVATLWPVSDQSTKWLMTAFYRAMIDGASPPRALEEAQVWLRNASWEQLGGCDSEGAGLRWTRLDEGGKRSNSECPFAHPFYWEGFITHASGNSLE